MKYLKAIVFNPRKKACSLSGLDLFFKTFWCKNSRILGSIWQELWIFHADFFKAHRQSKESTALLQNWVGLNHTHHAGTKTLERQKGKSLSCAASVSFKIGPWQKKVLTLARPSLKKSWANFLKAKASRLYIEYFPNFKVGHQLCYFQNRNDRILFSWNVFQVFVLCQNFLCSYHWTQNEPKVNRFQKPIKKIETLLLRISIWSKAIRKKLN